MILITGANGFVGEHLCAELSDRGLSIRKAVRGHYSNAVSVGEVGEFTDWQQALVGVDAVVHLAARVHVMNDQSNDPLTEFRKVNVKGTLRLAEQAAMAGVKRFVFVSSIKVNGEKTEVGHAFSADDIPNPLDPYGVSKLEAEIALHELAKRVGMEVVIIRPPLVYGPGVKANFLKMMTLLHRGIPLPLGAIHNQRSLVSVGNLVDFIITCCSHPNAANQTFLVSDGEDLSTTELARRLGSALNSPARLVPIPSVWIQFAAKLLGKEGFAHRLCDSLRVDISKNQRMLDWVPQVSVDEGLFRTVKSFLHEESI